MKYITYLIFALIFLNAASAQEIQVVKDYPQEINLGDIMEIKLYISNSYSIKKEFIITENLPQNIEIIEPLETSTKINDGLKIKYYNWKTSISPNSIKEIVYKIKPLSLGAYIIKSTEVADTSDSKIFMSNPASFDVKCSPNNQCDAEENSVNCPEDCPAGADDGICNYKADGFCDPDCEEEPDCKKSYSFLYFTAIFIIILIFSFIWIIRKFTK